ncbi:MAG: hypothetical protein Q4B84_04970, partial [Clostridia bacterium]|nr:hypothetical protein [Clostridia bacterium]
EENKEEEEHNDKDNGNDKDNTKQNIENKTWKTLKRVGIPGLIVLAVVTSIVVFKDKIKSLFSNKKTVETPACKVKNSAI